MDTKEFSTTVIAGASAILGYAITGKLIELAVNPEKRDKVKSGLRTIKDALVESK